jgi:hypothetical protein
MLDLLQPHIVRPRRPDILGQISFFGIPARSRPRTDEPPSVADSRTSRAAGRVMRRHTRGIAHRVLDAIRAAGRYGRTDHELTGELRLLSDSVRSRRVRLRDEGLVADSGRRRTTPSGCLAVVWVYAGEVP